MLKTARLVPVISRILATLLLAGFGVPTFAQHPPANPQTPQRVDVQEEIQRLQQESVDFGAPRAEYKNSAEAALFAGPDPGPHAMAGPPSVISAQRLAHHPPKAAQKAFALGIRAQRRDRQTEAIQHFTTAVSLYPSYVEARAELGVLYVRTGEISKALEQFERGSELEPNSSMLHFNRAWALLSLGRAAEAEREARRVLALKPQQANAQRLIDLALRAQGGTHE
jgi:tetratricopeptide (TPR) repeat protein